VEASNPRSPDPQWRPRGANAEFLEPSIRDRSTWIVVGVIALAAILAFANTFGAGFVYDDVQITDTPRMLDLSLWREVWTRPFRDTPQNDVEIWRPITSLSFAANGSLNRMIGLAVAHPAGFHVANVLVHALGSALVAILLARLGAARLPAVAAGLVFAVHPIHVEAVANVVQRAELLAFAFGVLFLILHRRRSPWSALALFCALGSKESAIGFVALAVALEFILPDSRRRYVAWIGPIVALTLFLALRAHVLDGQVSRPMILENPIADAPTLERVATALRVQMLYLRLFVWPVGLSSDYSYDQIPVVRTWVDGRVLGFVAITLGACVLAWIRRRDRPRIGIAVAAYAALFAITSNVFIPIGTIAGERLAYAPSLALAMLVAEALAFAIERGRGRAASVGLVVIVAVLSILTVQRNRVWHDEITFFTHQAAEAPYSARSHSNLGIVLQRAGDDARAATALRRSLEIYPENSHAWYVLGVALYNQRGEPKAIVQAFDNALRFGPMHLEARVKFVLTLLRFGDKESARRQIEELARLAPGHPKLPELRALLAAAK